MPSKLNEPTTRLTQVNVDTHPIFQRLWGKEGFERLDEGNISEFERTPGLALIVFADNPTTFKESIDMAVIAPEIAKVFAGRIASKGFTDPAVGRAIASRLGLTRLPAVGFFRNGEFLGALQGLKTWEEYVQGLVEIGGRATPPKRTIAINAN